MPTGLVTKSTGIWYDVMTASGETLSCRIRGKFKLHGLKLTNPVAVGDEVTYEQNLHSHEQDAVITDIHPRRNYVVRQSPRQKHQIHLIAANIDLAVVVVTLHSPTLKPGFIDRYLLMTEPHDIPVCIVFNKADLYSPDDMELYEVLRQVYTDIGYKVMVTSTVDGRGIDDLMDLLRSKRTLIGGQSGVGKSSILNALMPSVDLRTDVLSDATGKGQHTTTFAQMYFADSDTAIIDTPGIKTLSFNNLSVLDVAHNFREFFQLSQGCRFSNCTHRNEPNCAVKDALEAHEISFLRYEHYLTILDDIERQNYWERHTDY